ncbi:hypothetical protein D1007_09548 [Hordeum vulgare]|nr:hypothetical protein D1007_09548 [Hordeum vulgare]
MRGQAMATALRQAARRAAEAFGRPLSWAGISQELTPDQKKDALIRLAIIQVRKEELYNQISAWHEEYCLEESLGNKNVRLLKQLSEHVEPRPEDHRWRRRQRSVYYNRFLEYAGAVFIGTLVGDAWSSQ